MPLGKRSDYGDAKYSGVEVDFAAEIEPAVLDVLLCGFDFAVAPLVRADYRPPAPAPAAGGQLVPPFNSGDVLYLPSSARVSQVVGKVSGWIDPDSSDAVLKAQSVSALRNELAWAAHLGLQAVMLPPIPEPTRAAHYSQIVHQALTGLTTMALWLTVPLSAKQQPQQHPPPSAGATTSPAPSASDTPAQPTPSSSAPPSAAGSSAPVDPWEAWHQFRALTDYHNLLGCVLEVGAELPSAALLDRWSGEPVKALLLPTSVFSTNKRGYPVLSKAHQDLVARFFKLNVQVVLTGPCLHTIPEQPKQPSQQQPAAASEGAASGSGSAAAPACSPRSAPPGMTLASFIVPQAVPDPVVGSFTINDPGEKHPLRPYWEYFCFLFRKLETLPERDRLEADYRDYLQAPLQPLQDNLESATYETFEKDVTKYDRYEQAVYRALLDRVPDAEASTAPPTVVMVVGAGRGPLVRSSMRAAERSGRRIQVYAVEKNPNAVVHIQTMLRQQGWEQHVTLVYADMRLWQAPQLADILVSELLGSFGDNELSPECLDGAQRFLKPDGISIPQAYTSFLAPVTTHKLYNDVKNYKDLEHFETPYVVRFHRHHLLAPTQPVFTFEHPNRADPIDNSRYARLVFARDAAAGAAALHGFAGYFESVLYKDVTLNTHPPTQTPGMFSWFPIFFPLREPVYVPAGASVEAHVWRCCSHHKVWYEWGITAPVAGPVHNVGGRSYYVGL